jgi:hypothetical protein
MPGRDRRADRRPRTVAARIDRHSRRRLDPHQQVVDGLVERAAVEHQIGVEAQHVRHRRGLLLVVLRAALPHHVPEQHGALKEVGHVLGDRTRRL